MKAPLGVVAAPTLARVVLAWVTPAMLRTPDSVPPCWPLELPHGWSGWVRSNDDAGTSRGHGWLDELALTVLMVLAVSPPANDTMSWLPLPFAARLSELCADELAVW